jgi:hypothetical protein
MPDWHFDTRCSTSAHCLDRFHDAQAATEDYVPLAAVARLLC